jgi:hypothetical protein
VRQRHVVARVALIVTLATVAVPALALSRPPSSAPAPDPSVFNTVRVGGILGRTTTTPPDDLPYPLASYRDFASAPPNLGELADPAVLPSPGSARPPAPSLTPVVAARWHDDPNVSWYGPGFYGRRTACGVAYTTTTLGVANRTLPCGTRVTFRNPKNGITITAPVIDRGPYVSGRQWDLSGALCVALDHCYTGEILWQLP